MEFSIEKCAALFIKWWKIVEKKGIELTDGKGLPALKEGDGCKYLSILEANQVLHVKKKEKVRSEYFQTSEGLGKSLIRRENGKPYKGD